LEKKLILYVKKYGSPGKKNTPATTMSVRTAIASMAKTLVMAAAAETMTVKRMTPAMMDMMAMTCNIGEDNNAGNDEDYNEEDEDSYSYNGNSNNDNSNI
jgi:hypothetical protein